jgi:hypothetical protein
MPRRLHRLLKPMIMSGFVLATVIGAADPSQAQVSVNIGINLPAPPPLVAIPQSPIAYAPNVDGNYFFYGRQYYVFVNGVWYVSPGYNGPWTALAPEYVPRPLLAVPLGYYRRPPEAWRQWSREAAPRWEPAWGRRWEERGHEDQAFPREERRGERREERHEERR